MAKDTALLLLRVLGLLLAMNHGSGKVTNLATGQGERFIAGVAALGFPFPVVFAWASALSELLGGALVAVGFVTRPAAFFAAFTMFVAAFMRHKLHLQVLSALHVVKIPEDRLEKMGDPESAIIYLVGFLAILLMGPGRFSVDSLLTGKRRTKSNVRS